MKTMFKFLAVMMVFFQIGCATNPKNLNFDKVFGIRTAVFSPDGEYLYIGTNEWPSPILKFNAQTRERVQTFKVVDYIDGNGQLILSRDGRQLLSLNTINSDGATYKILDAETGEIMHTLPKRNNWRYFATDNGFNAVSFHENLTIYIREAISDKIIKTIKTQNILSLFKHQELWYDINASGTKCYIYSYVQKDRPHTWMLYVIDLENDEEEPSFITITSRVNYMEQLTSVAISPDGQYIALGTTEEIKSREVTEALAKSREVEEIIRRETRSSAAHRLYRLGFVNHYIRYTNSDVFYDVRKGFDFKRDGIVTIYDLKNVKPVAVQRFEWNVSQSGFSSTVSSNIYGNHENTEIRSLLFSSDSKTLAGISTNAGLFFARLESNNKWRWAGNPEFTEKKSRIRYYNEPSSPYYEFYPYGFPNITTGRIFCFDPVGIHLFCMHYDVYSIVNTDF